MIGIITMYYNSLNYGGNLQAYALCKYLEKEGATVEQIAYENISASTKYGKLIALFEKGIFNGIKGLINSVIIRFKYNVANKQDRLVRKEAFYNFSQKLVPHSVKVYNQHSIYETLDKYNVFITGSDQVWNMECYDPVYFLDFVDGTQKKKISYAASTSMTVFSESQKEIIANNLQDYNAISVREKDTVVIIDAITNQSVEYVVDPTLLLYDEDWDKVTAKNIVEEPYVFGYFLGENNDLMIRGKEFAKKNNFKFVIIPFARDKYHKKSEELADIRIVDAGPEKFLSLIKHAEYIFTDSFHAVVFSFIFKKQFFVFNRDAKGSMNSRIISLTDMFDMQERFCATKEQEKLEYIEGLKPIDYNRDFPKFEECRERSYEFIRKNILEED